MPSPPTLPPSLFFQVPNVKRSEYLLIGIDDRALSLMDNESGEVREDLDLPEDEVGEKIRTTFEADQETGKDTMVTILKAIGKEVPIDVKTINGSD